MVFPGRHDRLRERDEGLDAVHVHHGSAPVVPGDLASDGPALLDERFEDDPGLLATSAVQGEDRLALLAGGVQHVDQDLVADLVVCRGVVADRAHLARRDDALDLAAHRDQQAVGIGAHDLTVDQLAAPQLRRRRRLLEQLGHGGLSGTLGPRLIGHNDPAFSASRPLLRLYDPLDWRVKPPRPA